MKGTVPAPVLCIALFWIVFSPFGTSSPEAAGMQGPHKEKQASRVVAEPSTSPATSALTGVLSLYRRWISPVQGDRCGFQPSCSSFAMQSLKEKGAVTGILMSGDRLMRCNIFKKPGADYTLLPNGKLFDPVRRNDISGD